ncbi:tripartite tricarboxylate transporter TctB family protein [Rhizobium sp. CC-YZS058]|uniref:tripartite tricarboxylate transporter TctB family protein n=1 Tax=Rhizobium sp. CC-YZS058 TaxID=3042153 RepID=UPI002B058FDB|nr:tripartite tricarboxylate transporter TctB family protein [Rhizobium sp. CC-YZS058]MEA3535859.1 tripartite tricarboxylate transporter TctB family protein [Rhizobium sp. CC-YZS058]
MILKIRSAKEFGSALLYGALGIAGLVVATDYSFGTAGRMGPGYFPRVISGLLILVALVSLLRSLQRDGDPIGPINWRGLLLVTASVCLFGLVLTGAGLAVALTGLLLVSALASDHFALSVRSLAALVALVAVCTLVFVKGLGVPMPLIGSWLSPLFAS